MGGHVSKPKRSLEYVPGFVDPRSRSEFFEPLHRPAEITWRPVDAPDTVCYTAPFMDQPTTTLPAKAPAAFALPTPPTRLQRREGAPPPPTPVVEAEADIEQPALAPAPAKRQKRQVAKKPVTSGFGFERRVVIAAPVYELGSDDDHVLRVEPSQLRDVVLQQHVLRVEPSQLRDVVLQHEDRYDRTDVKVRDIPMTLDELRKLVAWGTAYLAMIDEP